MKRKEGSSMDTDGGDYPSNEPDRHLFLRAYLRCIE